MNRLSQSEIFKAVTTGPLVLPGEAARFAEAVRLRNQKSFAPFRVLAAFATSLGGMLSRLRRFVYAKSK
jgi:hypothetical protein